MANLSPLSGSRATESISRQDAVLQKVAKLPGCVAAIEVFCKIFHKEPPKFVKATRVPERGLQFDARKERTTFSYGIH